MVDLRSENDVFDLMEAILSRIIKLDGVGKQRNRLTREVVLALRELMGQGDVTDETRDLAAFIASNLESIHGTIDITVAAWEKRNYWVKADKFRMEWAWSGKLAQEMCEAVLDDNWQEVAVISANVAEKLKNIQVSKRHRMGEPWHGAWYSLNKTQEI